MLPRLRRVRLRNFKSIGKATVDLEALTILVGANGAGKSNFVDALAFVRDCLADSVELAFKARGGIGAVRRRSAGHPTHIAVRLLVQMRDGSDYDYEFEIAARPTERFSVAHERCRLTSAFGQPITFETREGVFEAEIPGIRAQVASDRLALFAASATNEFRPLYDFLASMRFYSIDPERLRDLQEPDSGAYLKRDGSNAAAVLKRIQEENPARYVAICELLARAVPGTKAVTYRPAGQRETLEFRQDIGQESAWAFPALSMSDGTLRILGLMLALDQVGDPKVVGIEDPEATVHPAITELLVQVLLAASRERQVIVTTHSPDVLDYKDLAPSQVRVVTKERNSTLISPLSPRTRQVIRSQLYSPGELLRIDELLPDADGAHQLSFGPGFDVVPD
jgi:predicted ATPase